MDNTTEESKQPDQCLLRVIGSSGEALMYDRIGGKNDQFRPGETYVVPQGYGKGVKMVRAKCIDWFTILEVPLITTFIFEKA